jgi:hypothetical protein
MTEKRCKRQINQRLNATHAGVITASFSFLFIFFLLDIQPLNICKEMSWMYKKKKGKKSPGIWSGPSISQRLTATRLTVHQFLVQHKDAHKGNVETFHFVRKSNAG